MARDDFLPEEDARTALEAGRAVRFDLPSPCRAIELGLLCGTAEAYISVRRYGTSFHYMRRCANGHFVDHVKHSEVELKFGITRNGANKQSQTRDALTPPKRVAFNVLVENNFTCVYCGRRAGEEDLQGNVVVVTADHIIPKALIAPEPIRLDRDLLHFARDVQLVAACQSHNSTKATMLLPLDAARDVFIRHVLKGETRGANVGLVSRFETLYRLVEHDLRLKKRSS